jgi:hypothetical protein
MKAQLNVGGWLIGNSPKSDGNRLVYAMLISDVLSMDEYFNDERFQAKKPNPRGTLIEQCGDNIYYQTDDKQWRRLPSRFHNCRENFVKDVGRPVFVAEHFYYFGDQRVVIPDNLRGIIKDRQGISDKSYLAHDFIDWLQANYKPGILGKPKNMADHSAETGPMLTDLSNDGILQDTKHGRSAKDQIKFSNASRGCR